MSYQIRLEFRQIIALANCPFDLPPSILDATTTPIGPETGLVFLDRPPEPVYRNLALRSGLSQCDYFRILGIVEFQSFDTEKRRLEGVELRDKALVFCGAATSIAKGRHDSIDEIEGRNEIPNREAESDGHWRERRSMV